MSNKTPQDLSDEQLEVLEAFARALGQEAHVLRQRPDLLWQQLYNRLQWVEEPAVKEAIQPEFIRRTTHPPRPWAHNLIRPRESRAIVMTLIGHTGGVNSVAYSPDGKRIVSASDDKTIKIWDATTGEELKTLAGHDGPVYSATFSPDGKRIVSASADETLKLWDAETGEELRTLSVQTSHVPVAFSPDGKRIVSGSSDNTLKIWDVETGKELQTLGGYSRSPWSIKSFTDGWGKGQHRHFFRNLTHFFTFANTWWNLRYDFLPATKARSTQSPFPPTARELSQVAVTGP